MINTRCYITLLFGISLFLLGCHSDIDIQSERNKKIKRDFCLIKERTLDPNKVYSVDDCIALALKNNLDLKVKKLEEKIRKEQKNATLLNMLPQLNLSYDGTSRSNDPGSSSENIETGEQSLVPSKSSERTHNEVKAELVFSVLDFGLSYFNSIIESDKEAISKQQYIRTTQNLKLDVVKAYYRLAVSCKALQLTHDIWIKSKAIEKNIDRLSHEKSFSPLQIMRDKESILRIKQQLEIFRRMRQNAMINLLTLLGVAPWEQIRIELTPVEKIDTLKLPKINDLEMTALHNRPELYIADATTRISLQEVHKELLMMFPNVKLFADVTHSSNKYLYNQSWWEIGLRSAYNLLALPSQYKRWVAADMKRGQDEMRLLALTMGVLSQVRIAQANLYEVKERLLLAKKIKDVYNKQFDIASNNNQYGGSMSELELFKIELSRARAEIEYNQEIGNFNLAKFRLLNVVGVDKFDCVIKDKTKK